ncbi:MAG: low molecular weight protein-tyrosine-phosphatase [Rhodospirillaceae bacterium]|nr:low molecular weight protein-tyrosine-phosphatase [Rhodospirillaceae bacterium]
MRVLFVDAGNYCRSPAAETVARALAQREGLAGRVSFGSAGLKDKHAGQPPDPRTVAACAARGYVLEGFLCREIEPAEFNTADLILAMDRDNLAQLLARKPAGAKAEIALFLGDREVPDPYYGAADGFAAMMTEIETGVAMLLRKLGSA